MLYEVKGYMKEFLKKMHYMVERRDCGANEIEFFFYTNLVIQLSKPGWDLKDATLCKMARMS